jgi:hypothetical protein
VKRGVGKDDGCKGHWNWNTGNWKTGNWNTGNWNTGNWNNGVWAETARGYKR